MTLEQQFNILLPRIRTIIAKRKGSWTLSTLPWEDVESILMTRIWQQLALYDTERPFDNWANRVISNTLFNLLRNLCYKHARPCIASGPAGGLCAFNEGGDRCGYTASHKQCKECPLYAKWERKKQAAHNINSSLPLEHHDMEVQNMQEDFIDIAAAKVKIDAHVMAQLNPFDAKVYRMLFIDHMSMEEVSKRMKYKTQSNSKVGQVLRKLVARFKELARVAIENEDLA